MLEYMRFVYAGDIAGAWGQFGGLSAQMTHLGTVLAISVTDAALVAMNYDRAVRSTIEVNSRRRMTEEQREKTIGMLTTEHDPTKKMALRDLTGATGTPNTAPVKQVGKTFIKNNWQTRTKGVGGKWNNSEKEKGKTTPSVKVVTTIGTAEKEKEKTRERTTGNRTTGTITGTTVTNRGRMAGKTRTQTNRIGPSPRTRNRTRPRRRRNE